MKKILNILFLLILYIHGFSQISKISGYIKDSASLKAISNVNILIEGSHIACKTDDSGFFSLKNTMSKPKLIISHLNYKKQYIVINKPDKEIQVLLSPQITELNPITICSDPIINITKKLPVYVIDYLIIGNKILLLAYNHKKLNDTRLFLIDDEAKILLDKKIESARELYKDCFGDIYYLNKKEAVKIEINTDEIAFSDTIPRTDFDETIKAIDFKIDDNVYFHTYHYQMLIQKLHYINLYDEEKEKQTILTFADSNKIDIFEREYNVFFYTRKAKFYGLSVTTVYNNLNVFRSCQPLDWVDKHGRFSPISIQMQKIKDEIFVLNTVTNTMESFDKEGKLLIKRKADFLTDKHYKEKILKSEDDEKLYAVFMDAALIQLKEIDLKTGVIVKQIKIPDFPYIEQIKVANNQVYFLYKRKINEELKQLYTMPLG
ncbi:MAG: carboxypeptidase-like regulatory domain-containing protein [Bacteroidetes bacterium]|nr:carboxypeptidase-like regulatory domain-containing protein [Bacteroidota bacterium]